MDVKAEFATAKKRQKEADIILQRLTVSKTIRSCPIFISFHFFFFFFCFCPSCFLCYFASLQTQANPLRKKCALRSVVHCEGPILKHNGKYGCTKKICFSCSPKKKSVVSVAKSVVFRLPLTEAFSQTKTFTFSLT